LIEPNVIENVRINLAQKVDEFDAPFVAPGRGACGNDRRVANLGTTAARLMRAYAVQVETLRRLRHGSSQVGRVEHVHVNEGGRAIVGNMAVDDSKPLRL
jgi:hypothetical protein